MTDRTIPVVPGSLAATYLRVQSIMMHPDDVPSQDAMVLAVASEAIRQIPTGRYEPSAFTKSALFRACSDGGFFAGQVFSFLVRMLKHRPREASIAKAQFLVCRGLEDKHERTLKKHWSDYRTCSHLHAARWLAHEVYGIKFPVDNIPEHNASVLWLLSVAHYMLDVARNADASKLGDGWWCLPEFHRHFTVKGFEIPDLTDHQAKSLQDYRAPTHAK
jgi:hypothetical protein